ncbi:riboflavin synthase [Thermospira aquatica]|uniref:Riboflavin synthase n=1 Tax=Thermospira aquatica TaxID=2828656 RepID=A0AAX3BBJ6_9SPIR|nr:riboflavin synthase [Thermospira aquatica]URA09593.1 riboflavin synthase [Thermospira aquatica]
MFTGIIRYQGKIVQLKPASGGKRFVVETVSEVVDALEEGITSIALDGSCHTVERKDRNCFEVYSSFETLERTTLGEATVGRKLNLELPVTPSSFLDGHIVMGHVDGIGRIVSLRSKGEAALYRFSLSPELARYLVEKDSIAIDGISLTIFDIEGEVFSVAVIPQTLSHTTLASKREGDEVNIEVHLLAKYGIEFAIRQKKREIALKEWLSS